MKKVSLKIDDSIFAETEETLSLIKKPRNRYINEASLMDCRFKSTDRE